MANPSAAADVPEVSENPLEYLIYATRIARSMPDHYFCDSCRQIHAIAPAYRDPPAPIQPSKTGTHSHIVERCKRKVTNTISRRTFDQLMEVLEQTHAASVDTSSKSIMGCWGHGKLTYYYKRQRMSVVRPPCKQHFPLLSPPRRIPVQPGVVGFFHMHIDPRQDGRRTPLAGLMHQHVQMELKRFRIYAERAAGTWYCPAPPRKPKSYTGTSEDNNNELGLEMLPYKFEPRIVKHNGQNMFVMKTTVKAGVTTPLSFCPHQVVCQIPSRQSAHSVVSYNLDMARYNGGSIMFSKDDEAPEEDPEAPLFTYRLKDNCANRKPGEIDGLREAVHSMYYQQTRPRFRRSALPVSLYAACQHCPTEIKLRCDGNTITYTVWQNFGAEGSALDPVWQSHLPGPFLQHTHNYNDRQTLSYMTTDEQKMPWEENSYLGGPSVFAAKGAIRRMYKGC